MSGERRKRTKTNVCVLVWGGFLTMMLSPATSAQESSRGQQLFENHCQPCHRDLSDLEKKHEVKNLVDLQTRIAGWAHHMGEDWGNSEIDDVLIYLNQKAYHFKD